MAAQDHASDEQAQVRAAFDAVQLPVVERDPASSRRASARLCEQHALGQPNTRAVWFASVASGRMPRQAGGGAGFDPQTVAASGTAPVRAPVPLSYPARLAALHHRLRAAGRHLAENQPALMHRCMKGRSPMPARWRISPAPMPFPSERAAPSARAPNISSWPGATAVLPLPCRLRPVRRRSEKHHPLHARRGWFRLEGGAASG